MTLAECSDRFHVGLFPFANRVSPAAAPGGLLSLCFALSKLCMSLAFIIYELTFTRQRNLYIYSEREQDTTAHCLNHANQHMLSIATQLPTGSFKIKQALRQQSEPLERRLASS